MIIIGDQNIEYENIEKITSINDIKTTSSNATVIFDFDLDILKYTKSNDISSAVVVNSIKEVLYASSLNAKYIIPSANILIQSQKIADNYMFDSKILAIVKNSDELEGVALNEIDGAIYKDLL